MQHSTETQSSSPVAWGQSCLLHQPRLLLFDGTSEWPFPIPAKLQTTSGWAGWREETAQLKNSTTLDRWGARNGPYFVTGIRFETGLKHALLHIMWASEKTLSSWYTQILEWKEWFVLSLLVAPVIFPVTGFLRSPQDSLIIMLLCFSILKKTW